MWAEVSYVHLPAHAGRNVKTNPGWGARGKGGEKSSAWVLMPLPLLEDPLGHRKKKYFIDSPQHFSHFHFPDGNTQVCFQSYFPRWHKRAREKPVLFTHVIFEVGSGPAQQEDACALGVAVLAGQVQSRVPRLGERQEKGGHVSNKLLGRPAPGRLCRGWRFRERVNAHILCFRTSDPSRGVSVARTFNVESKQAQESHLSQNLGSKSRLYNLLVESHWSRLLPILSLEFLTCKMECEPYVLRLRINSEGLGEYLLNGKMLCTRTALHSFWRGLHPSWPTQITAMATIHPGSKGKTGCFLKVQIM